MNETEPLAKEPAARPGGEPNSALIRRLFEDHNRALMGFLISRLRSTSDAQDVAQEAYVRLLQLDQTDAVGFLRFRLFRIAANLVVDRMRRKTREQAAHLLLDEAPPERETVERAVLAQQQCKRVEAALAQLPEKTCRAFVLHCIDDLPTPEVARILKISERMVRVLVSQVYDKCKRQIELKEQGV